MAFTVQSQSIFTTDDLEKAGGVFSVQLVVKNPEVLKTWELMGDKFLNRAEAVFLRYVFQVHKYLIRLTPVDTGRLRGGWTAILDKYQQAYDRQLFDTSLYDPWKMTNKSPGATEYHFDQSAIAEGRALSQFQDDPLNIVLINNVPYGEHLEFGTSETQGRHFLELTRYKGELWFGVIFEKWFEAIAKEQQIVDFDLPDDQLEISN